MTREQHLAYSRYQRKKALRELQVHGNITLQKDAKSVTSEFIEVLKSNR